MALRPQTLKATKVAVGALIEFNRNDLQVFDIPPDGPSLKAATMSPSTNLLLASLSECITQVDALEKQAAIAKQKLESFRRDIVRKLIYVYLLPPETIGYIFRLAIDSLENVPQRFKFSIGLSHVSQPWRSIALQQPELWCSLDLARGPRTIADVELFIARSDPLPINVHIDDAQQPYYGAMIRWTSPQIACDRWKSLSLYSNNDNMLSILTRPLPLLESLEVVTRDEEPYSRQIQWEQMKSPPLRRFVYDGLYSLEQTEPFPPQLVELVLQCGVDIGSLDDIFKSCLQLKLCQVGKVGGHEKHPSINLQPPSGLETFVVEKLSPTNFLRFMRCTFNGDWKNLLRFGLQISSAEAHDFRLVQNYLITFLYRSPALTELCVEVWDHHAASAALKAISFSEEGVSFLPKLCYLSLPHHKVFGDPEDWGEDDDTLVNILSSRESPQEGLTRIAALRSVGVDWSGSLRVPLKSGYSEVNTHLVRYNRPWWIRRALDLSSPRGA